MSSITKQLAPLGIALFLAISPLAHAQDAADRAEEARASTATANAQAAPRPFEALDQNADGAISKDEAAVDPPLAQVFGTLDKDADGRLSPEEYAVYAQGTP